MNEAAEYLLTNLETCGYASRIISVERLLEAEEEIKTRIREGLFETEFYEEHIINLGFHTSPPEMPNAKSVIIIAMPRPQWGLKFNWNGEAKMFTMHPIYVGYHTLPVRVETQVNGLLASSGYHACHSTSIPLKLLAVRSGLARYGRNNIVYAPGMGSYFHLIGLYSDLPCEQDEWQEAKMLDRCEHCRACIIKCPTSAIDDKRFLIRAERCIAFHNEKPAQIPFPEWIDSSAHNCLIGCLTCQKYCPENRQVRDQVEVLAEFSYEETSLLLSGTTENLSPATLEKLDLLERPTFLDVLPRNLNALIDRA